MKPCFLGKCRLGKETHRIPLIAGRILRELPVFLACAAALEDLDHASDSLAELFPGDAAVDSRKDMVARRGDPCVVGDNLDRGLIPFPVHDPESGTPCSRLRSPLTESSAWGPRRAGLMFGLSLWDPRFAIQPAPISPNRHRSESELGRNSRRPWRTARFALEQPISSWNNPAWDDGKRECSGSSWRSRA